DEQRHAPGGRQRPNQLAVRQHVLRDQRGPAANAPLRLQHGAHLQPTIGIALCAFAWDWRRGAREAADFFMKVFLLTRLISSMRGAFEFFYMHGETCEANRDAFANDPDGYNL